MNNNKNHVITRKDNEQIMNGVKQSDVVILNTAHQCHPELVSGSQKLRRFRNKFGMTINNSANSKEDNKNVKNLLPYSLNALFPKKKLAFTLAGATHVDMSPTKAKLAFTLAEVLITLGIIGIVAAMTIPTLMQKYQVKRTVAILKEDQAIISQMLKLAIEENGEPEGWLGLETHGTESAKALAEKLNPYWKLALDCGVNDENGDCVYNGEYKYLNGTSYMNYAKGETLYKVKLNNGTGITYYFYPNPFRILFVVDVNGDKKPNVAGRDVFWFCYQTDKGLRPLGAPNEDYDYRTDCQLNAEGVGCAYYVLTFGNQDYLNK